MNRHHLLPSLLLLAACSGNGSDSASDAGSEADGAQTRSDAMMSDAALDGGSTADASSARDGALTAAEQLLYDDLLPVGAMKEGRIELDSYPDELMLKLGRGKFVLTAGYEDQLIAAKIVDAGAFQEPQIVHPKRDDLTPVAMMGADGFLPRVVLPNIGRSDVYGQRVYQDAGGPVPVERTLYEIRNEWVTTNKLKETVASMSQQGFVLMTAYNDTWYVLIGAKVKGDNTALESQVELEVPSTALRATADTLAQQGYVISFAEHSELDELLLIAQRIKDASKPLKSVIRQVPPAFVADEVNALSKAGYTVGAACRQHTSGLVTLFGYSVSGAAEPTKTGPGAFYSSLEKITVQSTDCVHTRMPDVLTVTAKLDGGEAVLGFSGTPPDTVYSLVTPGTESSAAYTAALSVTWQGKQYKSTGDGQARFHRHLAPTVSELHATVKASDGTEQSFSGHLLCDGLREM